MEALKWREHCAREDYALDSGGETNNYKFKRTLSGSYPPLSAPLPRHPIKHI